MADCKTCVNSVFDPLWGEYKCKKREIRIYKPSKQIECADYKEKVNRKGS